jgi:hypothetical protein
MQNTLSRNCIKLFFKFISMKIKLVIPLTMHNIGFCQLSQNNYQDGVRVTVVVQIIPNWGIIMKVVDEHSNR